MHGDDPRDFPEGPSPNDDGFEARTARSEEEESLETDRDWLEHLTGMLAED